MYFLWRRYHLAAYLPYATPHTYGTITFGDGSLIDHCEELRPQVGGS